MTDLEKQVLTLTENYCRDLALLVLTPDVAKKLHTDFTIEPPDTVKLYQAAVKLLASAHDLFKTESEAA
jgi:hypothetical protein